MRYALLVEYDGTEFHGSQLQKGVRTVQGELEKALEQIYGLPLRVHMASRTDAGVHALGQVVVFDGEERHEPSTLRDALNFHLSEDVVVRSIESVHGDFDPRRQATKREYVFTLNDGPSASAIHRKRETRVRQRLCVADMQSAAQCFEGTHDFASFAGPATPGDASTTRRMDEVRVKRGERQRLYVRITGNAFLHQQVRRMTGALVRVGLGKLTAVELTGLGEHPQRGAAGWPLTAKGLCLTRIEYGKDGPFQSETEYN